MTAYLARRLLESLVVLFVMSVVVYALIGLMPGDPIDLMITADPNLTQQDVARLKALYGLDEPLHERYWSWLTAALSGDLGYSRLFARPVEEILLPRLGNTLLLMGLAFAAAAFALASFSATDGAGFSAAGSSVAGASFDASAAAPASAFASSAESHRRRLDLRAPSSGAASASSALRFSVLPPAIALARANPSAHLGLGRLRFEHALLRK